jgi:hypothetical protein
VIPRCISTCAGTTFGLVALAYALWIYYGVPSHDRGLFNAEIGELGSPARRWLFSRSDFSHKTLHSERAGACALGSEPAAVWCSSFLHLHREVSLHVNTLNCSLRRVRGVNADQNRSVVDIGSAHDHPCNRVVPHQGLVAIHIAARMLRLARHTTVIVEGAATFMGRHERARTPLHDLAICLQRQKWRRRSQPRARPQGSRQKAESGASGSSSSSAGFGYGA